MRILVIDDEKPVRDMLKQTLKGEGFAVDTAEDGETGSQLARSNEYDVIVLDNRMPKKTGTEVVRELRAAGNQTPILMLSVLGDVRQKADLLNLGADDYLVKPYSYEELVARIRALLRRPKAVVGEVLTADDLVLDTKRHHVQRGKKDVVLTNKEFGLLEYLMRNAGTVLTRGMIMEHVWDMNIDPFSNTIESHIASLRKKIEPRGARKLIATIPSRGYKFDADLKTA
ncbi:MAG TPA: response regulator transcription factor [Candidatus Paceibacterota bacterium]